MFVSFCTSKVNDVGREESTSSSSILYKYVAIKLMICCIITQQVYLLAIHMDMQPLCI